MKKLTVIIFIISLLSQSWAQEPAYFNNVYQHNNYFAVGMTILEIEGGYVGYGGTEDPNNIGQMLLLYKISSSGDELIWKSYGENYHSYYYGSVGGAMINTSDGNFALTCHYGYGAESFGTLVKLNEALDTLWQKHYHPAYKTVTVNCNQTSDSGYIITGWVWQSEEDFSDLLLLKTDSLGNYQWHQTYGGIWAEHGENTIQTPDGGYLIGGYFWKPGYDHSLDAMVIKTDNLGNEEWTKYYGNPYVDDDMALVAMADDGNYLVASVYGEWVVTPDTRTGRIYLLKIDSEGNTIWENKIGPKMYHCNIRNIRKTNDGNLVATGFYYQDTISEFILDGWIYKFSQKGDSIWMRDYYHFNNQYDWNLFYDAYPTSDNGYIAIGQARPDQGGSTNKMWIMKVDSMGCDTAGCATGVRVFEFPEIEIQGQFNIYPNPALDYIIIELNTGNASGAVINLFDSLGKQFRSVNIPAQQQHYVLSLKDIPTGMYIIKVDCGGKNLGSKKFNVLK